MSHRDRRRVQLSKVRSFVGGVFGADLHVKRIESLADATFGVMHSASLAVAMIGQALAQARGLVTKHAIKQVDRMLSNNGIDVCGRVLRGGCRIRSVSAKTFSSLWTGPISTTTTRQRLRCT